MESSTASVEGSTGLPGLKELQTRFLFPFFIDRQALSRSVENLESASLAGMRGAWVAADPPGLYKDELVDHAATYLFGKREAGQEKGCRYLRLSEKAANRIFHNLVVALRDHPEFRVSLVPAAGCELFLTDQGTGVLSLALEPALQPGDVSGAIDFNYLFARTHGGPGAEIRSPHPSEDQAKWNAIKEEHRAKIAPAPSPNAPIEVRLGVAGGRFTLDELLEELLRPLASCDFRKIQRGLSIYSIAHLDHTADYDDATCRRALGPFLLALTQIEEPSHAGAISSLDAVPNEILNRRHWTASGLMASVHLVSDQAPGEGRRAVEFNQQRAIRIRDKYFVPYLIAYLQKVALQRALDDTGKIASSPDRDTSAKSLSALRDNLLEFGVNGHFPQVSSRHVLHRY
ncbi:MAG: hypothetical protein ACRD16_05680 [Thermoanaerobaculia bacterium]